MALLLNERGIPQPPSDIQRRLREVHPDLSIRFVNPMTGAWAICLDWAESDPRRVHVQRQDLDPFNTTDIIGYLPLDCSVAEAPAYVQKALRAYPKENVQRMADFVAAPNTGLVAEALEEALSDVLDQADPTKPMVGMDSSISEAFVVKRGRGRPRKNP